MKERMLDKIKFLSQIKPKHKTFLLKGLIITLSMKIFIFLTFLSITPWTYALTPIVVGDKIKKKIGKTEDYNHCITELSKKSSDMAQIRKECREKHLEAKSPEVKKQSPK